LGKPSIHSGKASYHSLKESIQLQKLFDANLITLPLSKEWVIKSGIKNFTGHTEELARSYKKNTFMLMYGKEFSVIPLTTHIPLQKVSKELRKIKWKFLFDSILKSKLYKQPKIALCGLNPHAGENGKVGREEVEILKPILKKYTSKLYTFTGPYSADTIFCEGIREKFDIILSCYHDQGLIPFKSIIAEKGINLTLGLDFIRVSPDHGTAFDIAGKNLASEQSLKECISLLAKL
jgi:4-hydroxythreonine-4-phosphate dehydrogenase